MKTKIQSPNRATYLEHLQVLHYQGIESLVLVIPANPSFILTQFQERTGLKLILF